MRFGATQWPRTNQSRLLCQIKISPKLHQRKNKTSLHATKVQNDASNSISESLAMLEDLDERDVELFLENSNQGDEALVEAKKGGKSQKRNDSFIDEPARLAEIDAFLFCGNVRLERINLRS